MSRVTRNPGLSRGVDASQIPLSFLTSPVRVGPTPDNTFGQVSQIIQAAAGVAVSIGQVRQQEKESDFQAAFTNLTELYGQAERDPSKTAQFLSAYKDAKKTYGGTSFDPRLTVFGEARITQLEQQQENLQKEGARGILVTTVLDAAQALQENQDRIKEWAKLTPQQSQETIQDYLETLIPQDTFNIIKDDPSLMGVFASAKRQVEQQVAHQRGEIYDQNTAIVQRAALKGLAHSIYAGEVTVGEAVAKSASLGLDEGTVIQSLASDYEARIANTQLGKGGTLDDLQAIIKVGDSLASQLSSDYPAVAAEINQATLRGINFGASATAAGGSAFIEQAVRNGLPMEDISAAANAYYMNRVEKILGPDVVGNAQSLEAIVPQNARQQAVLKHFMEVKRTLDTQIKQLTQTQKHVRSFGSNPSRVSSEDLISDRPSAHLDDIPRDAIAKLNDMLGNQFDIGTMLDGEDPARAWFHIGGVETSSIANKTIDLPSLVDPVLERLSSRGQDFSYGVGALVALTPKEFDAMLRGQNSATSAALADLRASSLKNLQSTIQNQEQWQASLQRYQSLSDAMVDLKNTDQRAFYKSQEDISKTFRKEFGLDSDYIPDQSMLTQFRLQFDKAKAVGATDEEAGKLARGWFDSTGKTVVTDGRGYTWAATDPLGRLPESQGTTREAMNKAVNDMSGGLSWDYAKKLPGNPEDNLHAKAAKVLFDSGVAPSLDDAKALIKNGYMTPMFAEIPNTMDGSLGLYLVGGVPSPNGNYTIPLAPIPLTNDEGVNIFTPTPETLQEIKKKIEDKYRYGTLRDSEGNVITNSKDDVQRSVDIYQYNISGGSSRRYDR